jgi:hypothetical protein
MKRVGVAFNKLGHQVLTMSEKMDVCEIANLIYEPLANGKQGK